MKEYKAASIIFTVIGLFLSHVMCANVAYEYCNMLWGIEYLGFSAPANTSFFLAVPYLFGIIIAFTVAYVFWKKSKRITM